MGPLMVLFLVELSVASLRIGKLNLK